MNICDNWSIALRFSGINMYYLGEAYCTEEEIKLDGTL